MMSAADSAPASPIEIQMVIEDGDWPSEERLESLCRTVIGAASRLLVEQTNQPMRKERVELSLLFTNDMAMRSINAQWRGKDQPTNVLSFPASPMAPGAMPGPMLGDIVLAYETIARESKDLGRNFENHLAHLLVHGYLHIFGYDHIVAEDAELMERHETRILATLGISDPYGHSDPA